jgi:hypothetical protein
MQELIDAFSLERVSKSGARFQPDKAKWFNAQYMHHKSDAELAEVYQPILRERGIEVSDEVAGFVAGISSMLGEAAAAGTSLGKAALNAAKAALDEHSPSKEFYKVGAFAGIGLVNALYEYEHDTYKAGYGVGESAKYGLSDAIAKVGDLIENGVDAQPTIRPVLDLSEITTGTDRMNRMLNMRPAVGVSAKLSDISSAMADRGQNGGNSDVVAAIKGLGKKISESGRDTYNINGVTYDDGSNITDMVKALTRAVLVEGRV